MVNVAIMGHGVVGSGVAEILINHKDRISEKIKDDIFVKYILDLRDFDDLSYREKFTKNFDDILNDPQVQIVAEAMGGTNPAYDFVKKCLLAGKSVVTSNKELVAKHGAELIKIAENNNLNFLFEASVGGGIPVLRPITQCLSANEITEISGILNGTTNYILNKMIVDNMSFDDALKLAQQKGYAEKNPAADIEGLDACRKICILATLAFGKHVYPEQVYTEGITNITLDDVGYADTFGAVIKLIAHTEKLSDGKIAAFVRPTLIGRDSILSGVNSVFNAILITGDKTGDVMFYGKGAGKDATASAVVADIIDCAKHIHSRKYISWVDGDSDYVVKDYNKKCKFYVCIKSENFEDLDKRFESQLKSKTTAVVKNKYSGEIAMITDCDYENNIKKYLESFNDCKVKILYTML